MYYHYLKVLFSHFFLKLSAKVICNTENFYNLVLANH